MGLGSNVGDSRARLARAVRALAALPGVRLRAVSRLYLTSPVGVVDQPDFLNAVLALDVPAGPDPETGALALLTALKSLERSLGRQPRERWGPREIDLDLLVFGRHRVDAPTNGDRLQVPHPRAHERQFVLAPLADLAPRLRPPGWGQSVSVVLREVASADPPDAVRAVARWNEPTSSWLDDSP